NRLKETSIGAVKFETNSVIIEFFDIRKDRLPILFLAFDEDVTSRAKQILIDNNVVRENKIVSVKGFAVGPSDASAKIKGPGLGIGRCLPLCTEARVKIGRISAVAVIYRASEYVVPEDIGSGVVRSKDDIKCLGIIGLRQYHRSAIGSDFSGELINVLWYIALKRRVWCAACCACRRIFATSADN